MHAKHVEGRESYHELDFVFKDPKYDLQDNNYLDDHRKEMMQRERDQEMLKLEALKNKRSQLYNWNYDTDKEIDHNL